MMSIRFARQLASLFLASLTVLTLNGCSTSSSRANAALVPTVSINLGRDWRCSKEGADTICRPSRTQDELKKVITWAAYAKTTEETLEGARVLLSEPKTVRYRMKNVSSTPISSKIVSIHGRNWVDAIQINSEVYGYETRYLETVSGSFRLSIKFSARKDVFNEFQKEIDPVINDLKINE